MVLPPVYVKSVKVTNASGAPAKLTARYHSDEVLTESNRKDATHAEANVQHDNTHVFEEKEKSMGTWTAVVPIREIEVEINGKKSTVTLSTVVNQLVGLLHIKLTSEDGSFTVEGPAEH